MAENNRTDRIYHREVEPDADEADYELLLHIADIEDVDVTELPPMYDSIDHFVSNLFGNPPSPAAQVVIEFSYYNYRVTIDQSGSVTLVRLGTEEPTGADVG